MKKTLLIITVLTLALGVTSGVTACDKTEAGAKAATGNCPKAAAKAAYDETYEATGCSKTAQSAANVAMATTAYTKTLAETGCSKSAAKAAYDAVYEATKCSKSATAAATEAAKKVTYDETYAKTSCSMTAGKAAEEAAEKTEALLASGTPTEAVTEDAS